MEKSVLLVKEDRHRRRRGSRWRVSALATIFTLFVAGKLFVLTLYLRRPPLDATVSTIAWSACPDFTEHQCGYLNVPMRWDCPLPNETVSLALRKLPATVPAHLRKGSLLINPGGPGGSGHWAVARFGAKLSVVVQGRYDIIGFDPRGVNLTTPPLGCYQTPAQQGFASYSAGFPAPELPDESRVLAASAKNISTKEAAAMAKLDAWTTSRAEQCEQVGSQEMLKSVSTAFVARDMLAIVDAVGEEKLHYWGFSYGTILGATFAAMFPDRIGRVVLDGVSDSVLYTTDIYGWGRSGMTDTNAVFDALLGSCLRAGPERCAMASLVNGSDSSAPEVVVKLRGEYDALYEKLVYEPLPVASARYGSGIVTASTLAFATFHVLYQPSDWPWWADAVEKTARGDGAELYNLVNRNVEGEVQRRGWDDNRFGRHMDTAGGVATAAIMCGDNDRADVDTSLHRFTDFARELHHRSITGDAWALWLLECRRWKVEPYEVFRGPYDLAARNISTSFPVVLVGNVADPVTPLSAAKKMAKAFGEANARLLVHGGYGHCSIAHPSLCTALTLRSYLVDGVVPDDGKLCKADPGFLFPKSNLTAGPVESLMSSDLALAGPDVDRLELERLAEAVVDMAKLSRQVPGGLGI